jgi:hypothetical protein
MKQQNCFISDLIRNRAAGVNAERVIVPVGPCPDSSRRGMVDEHAAPPAEVTSNALARF